MYVLAVVGAVGAAFAFKEVKRWAAEYLAKREARRRTLAEPISALLRTHRRRRPDTASNNTDTSDDDEAQGHDKGKKSV
ncbi:hypothetical protein BDQ17DRAFT_1541480 [Cyathus striatus]|nr:hypothetical protein BDQ17DRAFT_1541480 [Cyathus striatus]